MAEIDPTQLSDEDLEKALAAGVEFETLQNSSEPEPSPEEMPVPEVPTTEPEPATPPEPVVPEETEANLEAERLRLLAEELEAKSKHWESVAGRNAGELGFIKSQLKAIQAAQAAAQAGEYVPSEPALGSTQPVPQRDGLAEWAVQQAVQQSVSGFEASHPDVTEIQDKMVEYIKTSGYDMQSVLSMTNPIDAQREMNRALEEAYWHTKASVVATRRAELSAKREAIQTKAATNKMKASVSATASAPAPKPKTKTVDEMTDDEIEREMVRASGGRW